MKEGELAAAIERFKAAIKLDPQYAPAYYHLGIALQKKGDRVSAHDSFDRARKLDPRLKIPVIKP